jgi:hypothetical protein
MGFDSNFPGPGRYELDLCAERRDPPPVEPPPLPKPGTVPRPAPGGGALPAAVAAVAAAPGDGPAAGAPGQRHHAGDHEGREQHVVDRGGGEQPGEPDVAGGGVADERADARVHQGRGDGRGDDHQQGGQHRVDLAALGPEQPGGVAEDAQHQGVAADGVVGGRGEVGEHSGAEADETAAGRAEHQGEPYHHEQHQVGDGTGQSQSAEDADLHDQGHDDQDRGEQEAVQPHEV